MKFKILSVISLSLLFSVSGMSSSVVVSDIDDTIKRSHINGGLIGGTKTKNPFIGMSELYLAAMCDSKMLNTERKRCLDDRAVSRDADREIIYLTGTPKIFKRIQKKFLEKSNFPIGQYFGKGGVFSSTEKFKLNALEKIIYEEVLPYTELVLIGDNGQYDPSVYFDTSLKYPETKMTMFIHQIYSTSLSADKKGASLEEGQIAFLTASDLGLYFYQMGLINEKSLGKVVDLVLLYLGSGKKKMIKKVIPGWVDCLDFISNYERPRVSINKELKNKIISVENLVKSICSNKRI